MRIIYKSVAITALILTWLLYSTNASGATEVANLTNIRIGDVTVKVTAPAGFVETSARSPQLWQRAQSMTTGYSEVLANFVTSGDFVAFVKNDTPSFSEYYIVSTPKPAKHRTTNQKQFDELRFGLAGMQSKLKQNMEPQLSNELSKLNSNLSTQAGKPLAIKIGQVVPVSVNINRQNLLSYTVLSQLSTSNENVISSDTMIMTTGVCFLKGKVLMLNYYSVFKSPQDLETSRKSIENWAESLLMSNK